MAPTDEPETPEPRDEDTPTVHASEPADPPAPENAAAPVNAPAQVDAPDLVDPDPDAAEAPEPEPADAAARAMEPLPLRGTARPDPSAARANPLVRAHEALARAAAARGAELTPVPAARRHPLEAANEALEKARAAREHASRGGSLGLAREAEARAQLDELKRLGGRPPAPRPDGGAPSSTDGPEAPAPGTPKKRRL